MMAHDDTAARVRADLKKVALGALNNGDTEVAARFQEHIATIDKLQAVADAGKKMFDKVSEVSNMTQNRFYRTPMYLEQNMTLEAWEALQIDAALDAYNKATALDTDASEAGAEGA